MITLGNEAESDSSSNLWEGFIDFHRTASLNWKLESSDRNEVLKLLVQRIAQLPQIPKKVLAMYYYENFPPAEIATEFGMTENEIELIRTQSVTLLQNDLVGDPEQSDKAARFP